MFTKNNITEKRQNLQLYAKDPSKVFGLPGIGRKRYPWSTLYPCKCGNKTPWMHGFPKNPPFNEIIEDGKKYRVVCHSCFRHTRKSTYKNVVKEWNQNNCNER